MPKKVTVEEWVDELASGRWVPKHGQLGSVEYNEDTHLYDTVGNERCCLGVLCELTGLPFHGSDTYPDPEIYDYAPWLIEPFIRNSDYDVDQAVNDIHAGHLDQDGVLADFAGANDDQFGRFMHDGKLVETKPSNFAAVIEMIRDWYGLEERGQ